MQSIDLNLREKDYRENFVDLSQSDRLGGNYYHQPKNDHITFIKKKYNL
jgi:hypothetical protein